MRYTKPDLKTSTASSASSGPKLGQSHGPRFGQNNAQSSASTDRLSTQANCLVEIGHIFASSVKVEEAFEAFAVRLTEEIVNIERCTVIIMEESPEIGLVRYTYGIDVPGTKRGAVLDLSGTIAEQLLEDRTPVLIQGHDFDDLVTRYRGLVEQARVGIKCFIGIPLIAQDHAIGTFLVSSTIESAFSQDDFMFIQAVGSYIAGMIANMPLSDTLMASRNALEHAEQDLVTSLQDLKDLETSSTALFEAASQGILICDEAGRIIRANTQVEKLFGYTKADMLGLPVEHFVPAGLRAKHVSSSTEYTENPCPRPMGNGILMGQRKNGSLIPLELGLSSAETPQGKQLMVVINDISERTTLERKLGQAQKMQFVGQLASGIAHDFNNLLTAVMGYNNLGLQALGPGHPVSEYLESSNLAADHAASIVKQLLVFAKNDSSKAQKISINQLILETHGILCQLLGANIELVVFLDLSNPMTLCDPTQVEQVLINLMSNGRDAMPRGANW